VNAEEGLHVHANARSARSIAAETTVDLARAAIRAPAQDNAATVPVQPPFCVAYLVNQYPKVSHSFIRREILGLERLGLRIERFAVRGWDADVADPADIKERSSTRYLLEHGVLGLVPPVLRVLLNRPRRFITALLTALKMARRSDRSWPHHIVYFAEACLLLEWLSETGATHLHAHFGTNPADIAVLARALGGPPFSFTVHGPDEFDRGLQLSLAEKVAASKFTVAISAFTRSQLFRRAVPTDWPKLKVVHCGLDQSFHQDHAASKPMGNTLLCVGRLSEAKGHLILIEALAIALRNGADCHLVLAGDGELRGMVEDRIRALGLESRVRITGWVSEERVRKELLAARVLVAPSFQEGLPVVIMEAMALRRPVIASAVSGIPELVLPGETGWLVPPGSVLALAAAIAASLEASCEDLERMGMSAQARVKSRHSIDQEVTKLTRLFLEPVINEGITEWTP
jgi:colanic acid/amylovoran biosynthesis glycosyltransferase